VEVVEVARSTTGEEEGPDLAPSCKGEEGALSGHGEGVVPLYLGREGRPRRAMGREEPHRAWRGGGVSLEGRGEAASRLGEGTKRRSRGIELREGSGMKVSKTITCVYIYINRIVY